MEPENWSWSKFFDLSPNRFGKDTAIGFRLFLIIAFISCSILGVIWIKDNVFGKKAEPTVTIDSGGAPVDNSSTKKWFSFLDINFGGRDN